MKKLFFLLVPIAVLLACEEEKRAVVTPIKAVKTIVVSQNNQLNSRHISGIVTTSSESELSFRVGGRVADVNVKAGDRVKKNQILANLEQKEYLLAVQSAQAQLASAIADLFEKENALKRQQRLKKKDFVSQANVDQAQAAHSSAKSAVDIARSSLENKQNNLDNTVLKAPFSGSVATRSVEPFTEISAAQAVFVLQSQEYFTIEVLIPETLIRQVSYNSAVKVTFPTLEGVVLKGNVSQIGAKAISGNAFPVKIEITEKSEDILAGMTAQVEFKFGSNSGKPVYIIPVSALDVRIPKEKEQWQANDGVGVFILNKEKQIAEKRTVNIRDIRGNSIEVVDGLQEGEELIIAGVPFIRNGQKVKKWLPNYNQPATINLGE